ncbi:MAG: WD40/YVTN/BNR-like repeat-containing protein [Vicinamibacteria bacterium]
MSVRLLAGSAALVALCAASALAQPFEPSLFEELHWRMIGPHRASRVKAATGVRGRRGLFYMGVVNGGVWQSNDYGRVWTPIFDDQPTGSIGAIAVAPSNPDVIYVGSGEGMQRPDLSTGDGVYKSTDAGRSWQQLGLRDAQQIAQIVVDPGDPERLYVAALGHPYGPNQERGVFRSRDGGRSFERVLHKDENTGAAELVLDPADPRTIYAVLWQARLAPWENGVFNGPGSGLYKSTDGGDSWRRLGSGLPGFEKDGLGRIGLAVAPSDARRLYATVEAPKAGGIYRSDDAGESWARVCDDERVYGRASDFAELKVDPRDPDVVYSANVVAWKSRDGGRSWRAWRGAPGGDDYQRIWIDPDDPAVILMVADQGAIVTVNGGETWSSWYNQPTAQFYHVSTDNAFPYRVCGGQQESGSACVASRGDHGRITFRDWRPVGADEYAYVAPDPLDPDIVYGGRVSRFDRRTGQVQDVSPRPLRGGDYRVLRTAPLLFSPLDPKTLYFASSVVWKTTTGGREWQQISPDLSRTTWEVPRNVGVYADSEAAKPTRRGVVYTLAPSPVDAKVIWAGTDDGLIHVTRDGGRSWTDVTPPELTAWAKVSLMDASHFDAGTAYAAVNTIRLDDLRPHVYRTHDGGRSWQRVVEGMADGSTVNVVREDPVRRGLLYAGTEREVYVSFDDGDHWQSLRLDMPATSIRDLVVKDDDLVAATHGRSFWILDDLTPLRQLRAETLAQRVALLRPQRATRVRDNLNTDTPLPPDEPAGENPPDGAILHYYLRADAPSLTLEVLDPAGAVLRRYSSADPLPPVEDEGNTPAYWIRPPRRPSARAGLHRFVWDLRYEPPAVLRFSYPIAATPGETPLAPRGVLAHPGEYSVRLTAAGQALSEPLTLRMDPRVKTPEPELRQQLELSLRVDALLRSDKQALDAVRGWRAGLAALARERGALSARLRAFDEAAAALEGRPSGVGRGPGGDSLAGLNAQLASLLDILQDADLAPTAAVRRAVEERALALEAALARHAELEAREAPALERELKRAGLPAR